MEKHGVKGHGGVRKSCNKLEQHPLSEDEEADLTQVIVISVFRRPSSMVPWSMQELNRMEQLWQTVLKTVWHLMCGTCVDVLMFPSHSGDMQCPRSLSILWEATARHIERDVRHEDVMTQIIVKELKAALDLWMCSSWEDLVEGVTLRSWEEARHNIFLRLAKRGSLCRMRSPDLSEQVFGKPSEGISLMTATKQCRKTAYRWREMSGDW